MVDNIGEVLESFDYYPFGLLMPRRNTTGAGTMEKFTGKERDEAIDLDYFGARYYDAALGRFFVTDRFADKYPSMTPYQYAANNPMDFIDVNGDSIDYKGSKKDISTLKSIVAKVKSTKTGRPIINSLENSKVVTFTFTTGSLPGTTYGRTNVNISISGETGEMSLRRSTIIIDINKTDKRKDLTREGNAAHESQHAYDALNNTEQYVKEVKESEEKGIPHKKRPHEKRAEQTRKNVEAELKRKKDEVEY